MSLYSIKAKKSKSKIFHIIYFFLNHIYSFTERMLLTFKLFYLLFKLRYLEDVP